MPGTPVLWGTETGGSLGLAGTRLGPNHLETLSQGNRQSDRAECPAGCMYLAVHTVHTCAHILQHTPHSCAYNCSHTHTLAVAANTIWSTLASP